MTPFGPKSVHYVYDVRQCLSSTCSSSQLGCCGHRLRQSKHMESRITSPVRALCGTAPAGTSIALQRGRDGTCAIFYTKILICGCIVNLWAVTSSATVRTFPFSTEDHYWGTPPSPQHHDPRALGPIISSRHIEASGHSISNPANPEP